MPSLSKDSANRSFQTMENLIKQTRARFTSGQPENKDDSNGMRERKITSESQSFGEKKRGQSWIRRQFSRQKSSEYDLTRNYDYQIAVAAAACAIQSLEEMRGRDDKDKSHKTNSKPDPKSSNKSKKEDGINPPQSRKSPLKSSDQSSKKSFKKDADSKVPVSTQKTPVKKPSHKNKLHLADIDQTITPHSQHQEVDIERPTDQCLITKPSTSTYRHLNIAEEKNPETPLPKPYRLPTSLTRAQAQPVTDAIRQRANKSRLADSQADAWEKQEMASLKERYEKTRATIDAWENKKKEQAKRKIEKIEAELYKKRVKTTQSHRLDIKVIEGIAGGARTQADENKRNEEFTIENKTNKIRATGKLPPSSLCF